MVQLSEGVFGLGVVRVFAHIHRDKVCVTGIPLLVEITRLLVARSIASCKDADNSELICQRGVTMCFFFSLIPMTVVLVVAYFVLFSSSKAEGGMRIFGRVLGTWLLLIAVMFPVGASFMTLSGKCPMMGGEWECPMQEMIMKKQMLPAMPPAQ